MLSVVAVLIQTYRILSEKFYLVLVVKFLGFAAIVLL